MMTPEQLELAAHSRQLVTDLRRLVERYRTVFDWDAPELDRDLSDTMILTALREALDAVEEDLRLHGRRSCGGD